ncbi:MAG: hypothetical protein K8L97_27225 [Anaerolineae bacterium]|nr:hypothetical protein [Anaerolineae bacterium]
MITPNTAEIAADLSQQLKWNGFDILRVALEALTDANFHREAEVIEQMLKVLETSDKLPTYTLTCTE